MAPFCTRSQQSGGERFNRCQTGEIELFDHHLCIGRGGANGLCGLVALVGVANGQDHHRPSSQSLADSKADAAVGAGDDGKCPGLVGNSNIVGGGPHVSSSLILTNSLGTPCLMKALVALAAARVLRLVAHPVSSPRHRIDSSLRAVLIWLVKKSTTILRVRIASGRSGSQLKPCHMPSDTSSSTGTLISFNFQ